MEKTFFFFDTETTGLIQDYSASAEDFHLFPRITQLSFASFNEDGKLIRSWDNLIKPDGWTIPSPAELISQGNKNPNFFIEKNMSTERCEAEGVPISYIMDSFIDERKAATHSIAHNISFDSKIIRSEMFRMNRKEEFNSVKICTMQKTRKFCALPKSKCPTLQELHNILFGCDFINAHDSFNDMMATAKCFFELKRKGVFGPL